MKFFQLYNSIIDEAKIDDILAKTYFKEDEKNLIRTINNNLSNNTKYVEWLVRNLDSIDDSNSVVEILNYFDKYQSRFDEKDINKYSVSSLKAKIKKLRSIPTKSEKSIKASKDAPKAFENDKCVIFGILTEEAAKKYGKGTKWCISAENNNMFGRYISVGNQFYFLFDKKNNEKYAIAYNRVDDIIEIYNQEDQTVDEMWDIFEEFEFELEDLPEMKAEVSIDFLLDEITRNNANTKNWSRNEDGTIDVDGNVSFMAGSKVIIEKIRNTLIKDGKLTVKFRTVTRSFSCSYMKLTSLEGCPKHVGYNFSCHNNQLTSLEGCPKEVGGNFTCTSNQLTSLRGMSKRVVFGLFCDYNSITSLEGIPKDFRGTLRCNNNNLTNLMGIPKFLMNDLLCGDNPLTSLEGMPEQIDGNLTISNTSKKFTEEEIREVSSITGNIYGIKDEI